MKEDSTYIALAIDKPIKQSISLIISLLRLKEGRSSKGIKLKKSLCHGKVHLKPVSKIQGKALEFTIQICKRLPIVLGNIAKARSKSHKRHQASHWIHKLM